MKRVSCYFLFLSFCFTFKLSTQNLFTFEDHFDSVTSSSNWHHTQDYRGGGVFEVVDGQFKRTTGGFVFYYNDSFTSGAGIYEFKAKGDWSFFWRGSTNDYSGRALQIQALAGMNAVSIRYGESNWYGYDHQYHNGSHAYSIVKNSGVDLLNQMNNIKIVDSGDSAKIYVNDSLILSTVISQAWRNDGYIEIGASEISYPASFDDIMISAIIDSSGVPDSNRVRIPLTVSENSGKTRTLYWGKRKGATRGIWGVDPAATRIDSIEGEEELPPPPPYFDANFIGGLPPYVGYSYTDMRGIISTTQVDTYLVRVRKSDASSSVLFKWSKELIKEMYKGHVMLYRSSTFKPINVNMKLNDSLVYVFDADETLCYLRIRAETSPVFEVNFERGWNLVSTVNKAVQVKNTPLFSNLISKAYSFDPISGYQGKDTLCKGTGYWMKFDNAITSICDTNEVIWNDTISVHEGWNLIGSVAEPTPVNTIGSIPANMVTSNFFAYSNGYYISDTLQPMKAYWVLVNQAGQLILSAANTSSSSNQIRMETSSDLPPAPPSDEIMSVAELPTKYALNQNFPNPFNPITTINYTLPDESKVSLRIYNMLGQVVDILCDEIQTAGYKTRDWNAVNATSGIYFCRFEAKSINEPKMSFVSVNKLILIK